MTVLDKLENDKITKILMRKRWEGNSPEKMKPLLKRLCLLENQDPSIFLPLGYLDTLLDPNTHDDEFLETRFNATMDDRGLGEYSKTNLIVPGVLHITKRNQRQWVVFSPPGNSIDDEMMFFGELYVSYYTTEFAPLTN
jgi:hypothetical protein